MAYTFKSIGRIFLIPPEIFRPPHRFGDFGRCKFAYPDFRYRSIFETRKSPRSQPSTDLPPANWSVLCENFPVRFG